MIEKEKPAQRQAVDVRHKRRPAAVESPPRTIEVESFGGSNRGLLLRGGAETQLDEARSNPDFFVDIIENVGQSDPRYFTLKVLDHNRLRPLLQKAKQRRHLRSRGRC